MVELLKEIVEHQEKLWKLKNQINDKDYWINKAVKEAGFIPTEGDWISVKVETWEVAVYVYHKSGHEGAKYWINGKWFDTPFPKEFVSNTEILKL